jgi:hypothetical protein
LVSEWETSCDVPSEPLSEQATARASGLSRATESDNLRRIEGFMVFLQKKIIDQANQHGLPFEVGTSFLSKLPAPAMRQSKEIAVRIAAAAR